MEAAKQGVHTPTPPYTGAKRAKIRTTGHGSDVYGKCEICLRHASEVFAISFENEFIRPDGSFGWACAGAGTYGHRECLEDKPALAKAGAA